MTVLEASQTKTELREENDQWWASATDEQKNIHCENLAKIKQWFKTTTEEIRRYRLLCKKLVRHETLTTEENQFVSSGRWRLPWEFRHRHIAYSLYRGRQRAEIERPSYSNLPTESLIRRYLDEYREALRPNPS